MIMAGGDRVRCKASRSRPEKDRGSGFPGQSRASSASVPDQDEQAGQRASEGGKELSEAGLIMTMTTFGWPFPSLFPGTMGGNFFCEKSIFAEMVNIGNKSKETL